MSTWPPADLDPECQALCEAMNNLPGIMTISSCCGHGNTPFGIWFVADELRDLPRLLYWFDVCHSGAVGWQVIAKTDCGMSPVTFRVEGPTGDEAYAEAKEIADMILESLALAK